ncbi:PREDICTED: uncharacterized protein LOC106821632 [Priapulus caudatus]|uniref:Uncharacterized protein LOC106821632 n=1 Tax=Priapulus caudatus TaxID=37621 RepID=A0ABM1FC39_PRICU|nr:PREDICTED: uncharacterized protein LOC106821632 [Priapulus caudatus]
MQDREGGLLEDRCSKSGIGGETPARKRSREASESSRPSTKRFCSADDRYPLPEAKFQKGVIKLLLSIRDTMLLDIAPDGSATPPTPVDTEEEFDILEERLDDEMERATLKRYFRRLGGVDATDMIKKSMSASLSNKIMAKMNLKGKCAKIAFAKSRLFKIICEIVIDCHRNTNESRIMVDMAKYLKCAPERLGGGGRRKR